MNELLAGFINWHRTGNTQEPKVFETIAKLIDSHFLTVRRYKSNYFEAFGFVSEGTFIDHFENEFCIDKLDNNGLFLLSKQPDDEAVKRTLNFLITQFYNTKYMEESKKKARSALDTIIEKLENAGIVEVKATGNMRRSKFITLLKEINSDEYEKLFTVNFTNESAKYRSLQRVVTFLQREKKAWYFDLVDEIAGYFEKYDTPVMRINPPGWEEEEDEFEDQTDAEEIRQQERPLKHIPGNENSDDDDQDEDYSRSETENQEFLHSINLDFEPVGPEMEIHLVTDMNSLKPMLEEIKEEATEDVQLLLENLLKRLKPADFNAFILTLILGGYSGNRVPHGITERVLKILGINKSAYYERIKGFNEVMEKLKKDDRYGFDDNDVLMAIDQLSEVFRRNFVI